MSRTQHQSKLRPLAVIHLLAILVVAGWWGLYFWNHTPARRVYRLAMVADRQAEGGLFPSFDPMFAAFRVALGDVAFGVGTVALLAIGTRPFVTRVQVWLDARTSGQAVSFGATDLESQALSANANRIDTP